MPGSEFAGYIRRRTLEISDRPRDDWPEAAPRTFNDVRQWWFVDGAWTTSDIDAEPRGLPLRALASAFGAVGFVSHSEPGKHYLPVDTLKSQRAFNGTMAATVGRLPSINVAAFSLGCMKTTLYALDDESVPLHRLTLIQPPIHLSQDARQDIEEAFLGDDDGVDDAPIGLDASLFRLLRGDFDTQAWIGWFARLQLAGIDLHVVIDRSDQFLVYDSATLEQAASFLGGRLHVFGEPPSSRRRGALAALRNHSLVPARFSRRIDCVHELLAGEMCALAPVH